MKKSQQNVRRNGDSDVEQVQQVQKFFSEQSL